MATKHTTPHKRKAAKKVQPAKEQITLLRDADFAQIPTAEISFSPFNYRKYFSAEALQDFAAELKQHGIISPLTVRVKDNDYELVAGERRLRAARIAELLVVPCAIVSLTDEQVIEIQLAENLQRENPHPLDEAQAVQRMLDNGLPLQEIALRLGKSKKFVYLRLKLSQLIEPFREIFYHQKMTLQQAVEIASLSPEAQQDFFTDHCGDWQDEDFDLEDYNWQLRQYKNDLTSAPFNIKDKKLLPGVGACTGCSFNSATLKTLFPELAKQAICSNSTCYKKKCDAHMLVELATALEQTEAVALVVQSNQLEQVEELVKQLSESAGLPVYEYAQVTLLYKPEEPITEDYADEDDEEDPGFLADAYNEAMQEYVEALAEYEQQLQTGKFIKGLYLHRDEMNTVWLNPEQPPAHSHSGRGKVVSLKTVQEALKANSATPAMIQEAITGMLLRETRAKELDKEKIQLKIHQQLQEKIADLSNNEGLTEADKVASRWLIFSSLDYTTRQQVKEVLFEKGTELNTNSTDDFYQQLADMTEQEFCYLIRMALLARPESKQPLQQSGQVLSVMAEQAGIDVVLIEKEQEQKTLDRNQKLQGRIKELEKKEAKLLKAG